MNRFTSGSRGVVAAGLILHLLGVSAQAVTASGDADSLYEQAIDAVLQGQDAARVDLLRTALKLDPDHAPSRAELGQILLEGRWQPAVHVMRMAAYDPLLEEYREKLAAAEDTERDHRTLARWCDAHGLAPEARAHWIGLLRIEPRNQEALEGLGAEWRDGALWDQQLAEQADARAETLESSAQAWEKRFRGFEKQRRIDNQALALIRREIDAGAIQPIERRVAEKRADDTTNALINAYLEASQQLPDAEVTASLCRIAIGAPATELRQQAAIALKEKPLADAMPLLLSALVAPIESESGITRDGAGAVIYEHRLTRRGEQRDAQHQRVRVAAPAAAWETGFRATSLDRLNASEATRRLQSGVGEELRFRIEAAEMDRWVEEFNASVAASNARVVDALATVSGESLGAMPSAWWTYWQSYTGYDDYDRPVDRTYDYDQSRTYLEARPRRRCECFVAGTRVWTRDGKRAVESLKPGDLVLARDPHRGGLVYRAVLDTTLREPSPMLQIQAGRETIRSTEGHPFWVIGRGWRMAKNLAVGDRLSSVSGPITVEAIDPFEDREAHNLLVEGAANYYVGETGLLVHDNTPRRPAVGLRIASR